MEQRFIDSLKNKIRGASLLETPSPVIRAIVAGTYLTKTTGTHSRPAQPELVRKASPKKSSVAPTDTFITYNPIPDSRTLKMYMIHHSWEIPCPTASVLSDVMAQVHQARLDDGWKCLVETGNCVVYAHFHMSGENKVVSSVGVWNTNGGNTQNIWVPYRNSKERKLPQPSKINEENEIPTVNLQWAHVHSKNPMSDGVVTRPDCKDYLNGSVVCLHVQHVQPRGDKPSLRCQVWIDRGHPLYKDASDETLTTATASLVKILPI
jgi:hypothetical protein